MKEKLLEEYKVWRLPQDFLDTLKHDESKSLEENRIIFITKIKHYIKKKGSNTGGYGYVSKVISEILTYKTDLNDEEILNEVYEIFKMFDFKLDYIYLVNFLKNNNLVRNAVQNIYLENKELFLSGKFMGICPDYIFKFVEAYYLLELQNKNHQHIPQKITVYEYPDKLIVENLLSQIKNGNENAKSELIKMYLDVVKGVAKCHKNQNVEYEDLVQEGLYMFMLKIDLFMDFEPAKRNMFLVNALHNYLTRFIHEKADLIPINDYGRHQLELAKALKEYYKTVYNIELTNEKLSEFLHTSPKTFEAMVVASREIKPLEECEDIFSGEDLFEIDLGEEILELLYNSGLSKRNLEIMELLYGIKTHPHTCQEVSNIYGLTRAAISSIEKSSIVKIRRNSKTIQYAEFMENPIHAKETVRSGFESHYKSKVKKGKNDKPFKTYFEEFKNFSKENLDFVWFLASIYYRKNLFERYGTDNKKCFFNESIDLNERKYLIVKTHNYLKKRLVLFEEFFNAPSVNQFDRNILNRVVIFLDENESTLAYIIMLSLEKEDYPLERISSLLKIDFEKAVLIAKKTILLYQKFANELNELEKESTDLVCEKELVKLRSADIEVI